MHYVPTDKINASICISIRQILNVNILTSFMTSLMTHTVSAQFNYSSTSNRQWSHYVYWLSVHPSVRLLSINICIVWCDIYTVSQKKRGVKLFAITSITVNRFWPFFHCWKRNIFRHILKTSLYNHIKHKSLKILQLLYHSFMKKLPTPPFFKFLIKRHITLLTYLLPCPAAHVPLTRSQHWGTVGHLARTSTQCCWQRNWHRARLLACIWAKGGLGLWQYANWVSSH